MNVSIGIACGLVQLETGKADAAFNPRALLLELFFFATLTRRYQCAVMNRLHQLLVTLRISQRCLAQSLLKFQWNVSLVQGKRAQVLLGGQTALVIRSLDIDIAVQHHACRVDFERYRKRAGDSTSVRARCWGCVHTKS